MLRTALLAALTALALSPAHATPAWTTSSLNFREGPGAYYAIIGYLPRCAALTTSEWRDGWVRVVWEGRSGWVNAAQVSQNRAHCR